MRASVNSQDAPLSSGKTRQALDSSGNRSLLVRETRDLPIPRLKLTARTNGDEGTDAARI